MPPMNTPVITCPAWCEHRTDSDHLATDSDGWDGVGTWTHTLPVGTITLADGRPVTAELSRVDDLDEDGTITPGPVKIWVGVEEHPTLTGDDLVNLADLLQLAGRRLADTTA